MTEVSPVLQVAVAQVPTIEKKKEVSGRQKVVVRHDWNITPVTEIQPGETIDVLRYVSVEIESENGDTDGLDKIMKDHNGWKDDGSLRNGVEINTTPSAGVEFERIVASVCTKLKKRGFEISNRCGLHTHVDLRDLDKEQINNIYKFFWAIEPLVYALVDKSRASNMYCRAVRRKLFFNEFYQLKPREELVDKVNKKTGDRMGLNLLSIKKHKTIEFRYHQGSLDPKTILNWVHFVLKGVDYALNRFDLDAVIDISKTNKVADIYEEVFKMIEIKPEIGEFYEKKILENIKLGYFWDNEPKYKLARVADLEESSDSDDDDSDVPW